MSSKTIIKRTIYKNNIKVLTSIVKKFGDGAHVIVPKFWRGKKVEVKLNETRKT